MARRGDHSRDELVKMILDSTHKMIEEEGHQSVSTRRIASAIGYTVGTLYNIFDSLEDIFVHINARIIDEFADKMRQSTENTSNAKERLYNIAEKYLEFSIDRYNFWALLFEYRFSKDTNIPNWYNVKIAELFYIVEGAICAYKTMDPGQLKKITGVVWSGIHGLCILNARDKLSRFGFPAAQIMIKDFLDTVLV